MPQKEPFIAHRCKESGAEHKLVKHLIETAKRAFSYANEFRAGQLASDIAMTHDIGKYSKKFQRRIRGAKVAVDHSTPGGQILWKNSTNKILGMIVSYCIMGHHGGLPNGGTTLDSQDENTLHGRLKKITEDCSAYVDELNLPVLVPPSIRLSDGFSAAFLIRMLFSALVDADYLDTEAFFEGQTPRGGLSDMGELCDKLFEQKINDFLYPEKPASELNARRTALLKNCLSASEKSSGLFTLTAPTGSGKTIASMTFALNHAIKQGKRRVIYIIPYNTIIEQNSAVFEDILGSENVLQHHFNIRYEDNESEVNTRKHLATENWDYPIVVTSSVQFFESLFANRTSSCRKLHNIANSVLIFDEAQMIPVPYLTPCVRAIQELVENYGCSAVLATATQSAIESCFRTFQPIEITENPQLLFSFLRRACIKYLPIPLTDEDILDRLSNHNQVLCIVNTKKMAQSLFHGLKEKGLDGVFHLSTLMYPKHRSRVLKAIRDQLDNGRFCRVISTSLVETGVDLDFPVVYREEAGLDSVVQAAGRCNREGKQPAEQSFVYVFKSADHKPLSLIRTNIDAARQALRGQADIASLEAIKAYFTQLYYNEGMEALDIKKIVSKLNNALKPFAFPFKDIAESFHLIEEDTRTIFVLHEMPDLEARLRSGERSRVLFRVLGAYSVSLYPSHFRALYSIGAVEPLDEEVVILFKFYYDENCGVKLSPKGGEAIFAEC